MSNAASKISELLKQVDSLSSTMLGAQAQLTETLGELQVLLGLADAPKNKKLKKVIKKAKVVKLKASDPKATKSSKTKEKKGGEAPKNNKKKKKKSASSEVEVL